MEEPENESAPWFAPFPRKGIWTALGLTRGAFFAILIGSVLVYVFWGGALWNHLGKDDFVRILVSYSLIPLAVAGALAANRTLTLANFVAGSAVLCTLKLLVTAVLALLFDLDWMR